MSSELDEKWVARLVATGTHVMRAFIDQCDWRTGAGRIIDTYDSPIEQAMAIALLARIRTNIGDFHFWPLFGKTDEEAKAHCHEKRDRFGHGGVFPHVRIGRYTVDFLFLYLGPGGRFDGIVVECDGHEFHDRTPQQAARDKSRDRDLQVAGYKVLRFTGSEIWKDAFACADTVVWMALNEALSNDESLGPGQVVQTVEAILDSIPS